MRSSSSTAKPRSSFETASRVASRSTGLEVLSRPFGVGLFVLQDLPDDAFREAPRRLAEIAAQHVDDAVGEGHVDLRILDLCPGQVLRDHHQRHVAHDLRRRRDLDDVAEHPVDVGIGLRHLVPALFKAQRARLRLEVGELAARHLVQVDLGGRRLESAFEGRVLVAHALPVVGNLADRGDIEPGVAVGMGQSLDDGAEAGLRGAAREGVHRGIDGRDPGIGGGEDRRPGDAGRVVGVEMDRQADLFLQRLEEDAGCSGFQKPRHVLEAENMGAGGFQRLAHRDVVFQVVFRAVGIEDVAGIADRAFADLALLDHGIHRDAHVLDPVEAVEDAEDVDAGLRRLPHEFLHDVVGIIGVADAVRGAEQHLRHDVGHCRAEVAEALPGAFLQEAVGHVKGGTAPAFDAEKLRQVRRIGRRHLDHVDRPHPGSEQRLVSVAHRRVGQKELLLARHPVGDGLRTFFFQKVARARGGGGGAELRRLRARAPRRAVSGGRRSRGARSP